MDGDIEIMIEFTEQAASRFLEAREENPEVPENTAFRVYVRGAGCSGFEFGFEFASEFNEDDLFFESHGARLVVDPISYQYVMGSTVDFKKELMGEYFTLDNPNAKTTCGCGQSFSV